MDSRASSPLLQRPREDLETAELNGQLFAGQHLRCLDRTFLSRGGYGSVYRGFWREKYYSKEIEVAVRRIEVLNCSETWKDIVAQQLNGNLSSNNVLKIFGVEEDAGPSRYFALEPYEATLDEFCNGQYNGPMPSDAQALYQIARGVNYLHKIGLPHGNLNPKTILISRSRMKVSEFGLCKYYYEGDGTESKSQLSHSKYWLRTRYGSLPVDEDRNRSVPPATVDGDNFATG